MKKFEAQKIEGKWQKIWEKEKTFAAEKHTSNKPKFYGLVEFPYPSGEGLHVGHPRSYTALDVICRKKRMDGYNVLFPIGFDSFGLPTENFAIKTKQSPAEVTRKNIENFTRQLKIMGFGFDWERMIITSDPEYYKWTQWIFLQLFKHGLAYKTSIPINWCPSCKIGLANEEVIDGHCERCGGEVEKRDKEQWMLSITKYADKLLAGLENVDYIERAKIQQQNWIGKSEGALVKFSVETEDLGILDDMTIDVFTTRVDTVFGITYMVIAPEHPLLSELPEGVVSNQKEIEEYITKARTKSDLERTELQKEKTGVKIGGVKAINPVNGEAVPVFIGDYVLGHYGTGAVMAVPAHDERDFAFAKKHHLPIKQVIEHPEANIQESAWTGEGKLINSDFCDGLTIKEAQEKIVSWLQKEDRGGKQTNYKLRDWVFSRQRYWGEPIPLVYCEHCAEHLDEYSDLSKGEKLNPGWVPLREKDLPLELPKIDNYQPTDTGESPLSKEEHWLKTKCPRCGGPARRETDTMPNWAGSSWYFLRYIDPHNKEVLADQEKMKYWLPVDWYNGGMEHVVLHLLYSRFWHIFLYDIGAVPTPEPYQKRTAQGMILDQKGDKMSKSRGNVINPDEIVSQYGADTLRTYIMFMGPFDQAVKWDTNGLIGVRRFLEKIWGLQDKLISTRDGEKTELRGLLHRTIKKVTEDIDKMHFNTAIAKMMELVNEMTKDTRVGSDDYEVLLKLISPFAPHMAEEIWSLLGNKESLALTEWPKFNPEFISDEEVNIVIQVNGKMRDSVAFNVTEVEEKDAKEAAVSLPSVAKWLEGKEIKKIIYVKNKIINIVV